MLSGGGSCKRRETWVLHKGVSKAGSVCWQLAQNYRWEFTNQPWKSYSKHNHKGTHAFSFKSAGRNNHQALSSSFYHIIRDSDSAFELNWCILSCLISVIRDTNVVQLDVDSEVNHVVGSLHPSSTDTRKPVFIGGAPGESGASLVLILLLCSKDHTHSVITLFPFSQIFSSQRASPLWRNMWAAWGTWASTRAVWASAKLLWSVEQSASGAAQQHNTAPNTTLTKKFLPV